MLFPSQMRLLGLPRLLRNLAMTLNPSSRAERGDPEKSVYSNGIAVKQRG